MSILSNFFQQMTTLHIGFGSGRPAPGPEAPRVTAEDLKFQDLREIVAAEPRAEFSTRHGTVTVSQSGSFVSLSFNPGPRFVCDIRYDEISYAVSAEGKGHLSWGRGCSVFGRWQDIAEELLTSAPARALLADIVERRKNPDQAAESPPTTTPNSDIAA